MKMRFPKMPSKLLNRMLFAAIAVGALAVRPASAGPDYWMGGHSSGNWSSGANWLSGNAPAPYDSLIFTNQSGSTDTPNNDFANGTPFDGILFTNSTGAFDLTGNSILISGQTNGLNANIGITNATSLSEIVANNLTLDWGFYTFYSPAGSLSLNGTISANAGGIADFGATGVSSSSYTVDGTGLIYGLGGAGFFGNNGPASGGGLTGLATVSGGVIAAYTYPAAAVIANAGPIGGTSATVVSNLEITATTGSFPLAGGTANSFTATNATYVNTIVSTVNTGTKDTTLIIPSGNGVLVLGTNEGNMYVGGISVPAGQTVQQITIGSGNGTVLTAGPMTPGNPVPGEIVIAINGTNTSNEGEMNAAIKDNLGGGPVSVIYTGGGSLFVNNTGNTYSGGTYVNKGRVQCNNTTALGNGPAYVASGDAEISLQNVGNGIMTNSFFLSPGCAYTGANTEGALRLQGTGTGGLFLIGTITLMGVPVTITNFQSGLPATAVRISDQSADPTILSGQITGPGTLEFYAGASGMIFSLSNNTANANNWTGGLVIDGVLNDSSTVKLLANNQLGGNNLTPIAAGTGFARLEMNGFNDTIGSLSSISNSLLNQVENTGAAASTLTIGSNNASGNFFGTISDSGTANTLSIVKIGAGVQVLRGVNNYVGSTFVNGGTLLLTNAANIGGAQVSVSGATLDEGGLSLPSCTNSVFSLTNAIWTVNVPQTTTTNDITGTLNLGGTANTINIASLPLITSYPATFHLISYSTLNGANNISLGSLPASFTSTPYAGSIVNNSGFIDLVLTSGPVVQFLTWTGTDPSNPNNWDINTSLNWVNPGHVSSVYTQFDLVTFNDSATGSKTVNVTTTVTPAAVTVSNSTAVYTLTGSGSISGSTGLTKQGTNLLILDENNNFSGNTSISNGIVQLGVGDGNGTLGSGAVASSGSLVFNKPGNNQVFGNNISGSGTVTEQGNDVLQLAGFNTFTGNVLVTNNSVLQQGSSNSLGFNNTITIANGSSLDLNGHAALNGNKIVAQGSGSSVSANGVTLAAIDSSATNNVFPAVSNVTLTADTTFGASASLSGVNARWDLRSPGGDTGNPGTSILSTGGNPYNLTKVGPGFVGIVSTTVDPQLANIDVQNGILNFEGTSTGLGNPTNILSIEGFSFATSGTFQLWNATNQLNKSIVLNDGGLLWSASGSNTIVGPINMNNSGGGNDCFIDVSSASLTLSGPISGNGTLYQEVGTNVLILNGVSPNFQGGVEIHAGRMIVSNLLVNALGVVVDPSTTLTVNGILGGPNGVNNNGAVTGSGVISNLLDNSGNIVPGTATAPTTLNVGGLTMEGSGQATVNLNNANTIGGGVNDLIAVKGNVTINGGIINVLPVGLLQDGVPYTIITYTGSLTQNGSLSASGANGYSYTVSTSTPGQINIIPSGGPPVWNGGSTNDSNWSDTNNWGGVAVGSGSELFFSGTNRLNNTNDTTAGIVYNTMEFVPGAGAFVLNGNGIGLNGSGIIDQSTNPETVDVPLILTTASQTFNGAVGTLIIGGGVSNTVNSSMVLSGNGILTNLFSSGPNATNAISTVGANTLWTILDNQAQATNTAAWYLELTNGTLVFGSASSAPNFVSTSQQGTPTDNQLGYTAGQAATLIISNGTYTTASRMNTGPVGGATGIVDVVSGTLSVASQFQGANGGLTSGSWLNVSGGTFTTPGTLFVSSRGPGFLNVSGTGIVSCAALDISRNAANGGTGLVNLNGGTISCSSVATETANNGGSGAPTATFNFNGGTLLAKASSATFYQGALTGPACPVNTFIQAGGATINDGGFAISINEPLQSGAVNDGGLKKLGAGTTTLNKTNTYNGPTVIGAGTLALGATGFISNTPSITIAGGATFSVASTFVLGSSQSLSNSSSTAVIKGTVNATSGQLALTYVSGPSLVVSNGTLTLAAGTRLTINNTTGTPLPVGVYTIIAASAAGSVAGTIPTSFTVTGAGTQGGQPVVLQISGGNLNLVVGTPALPAKFSGISVNGTTLTITGSGGAGNGQYVLLGSANLLLPISQWTPILTNTFDSSGNLNLSTNVVTPGTPQEFYLLQMP